MAGQHFVFLETIHGMKKALSRADDASDSDETIGRSTNRANKLKRSSRYAYEGRLDTNHSIRAQRKRIEHAGYNRTVVSRNPPKYDYDGDEVPDYEDDGTIDASPIEENPYENIKLEHLLAPLTSAADLPTHPSLSYPYYAKSITEMARNAEETLRQERAHLHRIKRLFTRFRGDEDWAPCGIMEPDTVSMVSQQDARDIACQTQQPREAALDDGTQIVVEAAKDNEIEMAEDSSLQEADLAEVLPDNASNEEASEMQLDVFEQDPKVSKQAGPDSLTKIGERADDEGESTRRKNDKSPAQSPIKMSDDSVDKENALKDRAMEAQMQEDSKQTTDPDNPDIQSTNPFSNPPSPPAEAEAEAKDEANISPPFQQHQHRVVTRAQTQAKSKTPTPPTSNNRPKPEDASHHRFMEMSLQVSEAEAEAEEYVPDVHPIFTFPASAIPNRDLNLLPHQADEIRRQLLLWVQKQEEVVRGMEELCYGLLRADRMRNDVLRWTKAEGHLHEMSDGEDWYDREEWGLEEDLVKGKEEDDDDTAATAKKTRQRRADR